MPIILCCNNVTMIYTYHSRWQLGGPTSDTAFHIWSGYKQSNPSQSPLGMPSGQLKVHPGVRMRRMASWCPIINSKRDDSCSSFLESLTVHKFQEDSGRAWLPAIWSCRSHTCRSSTKQVSADQPPWSYMAASWVQSVALMTVLQGY